MSTSLRAHQVDANTMKALMEANIDVTGAETVEVSWNEAMNILWVNVNGICALRICRIKNLSISQVSKSSRK